MVSKTQQYDLPDNQADVSELADTLEALLKSYGDDAQDGLEEARENAEKLLRKTRESLGQGKENIREKLCNTGCNAEQWVRDNPGAALSITAATGFVFGLLLGRR